MVKTAVGCQIFCRDAQLCLALMHRPGLYLTVQNEGAMGEYQSCDCDRRDPIQVISVELQRAIAVRMGTFIRLLDTDTKVSSVAIRFPTAIKFLTSTCFHLMKERMTFPITPGEHVKCQQIFSGQNMSSLQLLALIFVSSGCLLGDLSFQECIWE